MATLNGRLDRLECRGMSVEHPTTCRTCGLLHVPRPIPVAMVEGLAQMLLGGQPRTVPPLCLCGCCADQRAVAEFTHGS